MTETEIAERFNWLRSLTDGWDADGEAPKPTVDAISKAQTFVAWAQRQKLEVDDVDADVLGGVAITLRTPPLSVWVSVFNAGPAKALLLDPVSRLESRADPSAAQGLDKIRAFLGATNSDDAPLNQKGCD